MVWMKGTGSQSSHRFEPIRSLIEGGKAVEISWGREVRKS